MPLTIKGSYGKMLFPFEVGLGDEPEPDDEEEDDV